jgi:peptidoglycan/xylan/chitin deacetylase (PgdA/CDA1 family)
MNRILCICLFVISQSLSAQSIVDAYGAIIRSDTLEKNIYLCFTGHDFYEGFDHVLGVLKNHKVAASFFLTGDFIRNHGDLVKDIAEAGHFIGAHSDEHLLYCDWSKRDSLLHPPNKIRADIFHNLQKLSDLGIRPRYFMPPYEWYNQKVVEIAKELNQVTVNFSPGTRSNADYTTPDMSNYISSNDILSSIYAYERLNGMNGFHLLIHPGTSPLRKDKLHIHLDKLIATLKGKEYQFLKF